MASRQPRKRPTASTVAFGGSTLEKSPIIAMPTVFSLKPPACAPCTGLSRPPARPSKIWP
ncbi:hypothetical protein AAT18_01385 [Rhodococcus aetherivorans]|nr:hypothetical protein AAT18_01385 [Rhodococcus aetherivorans]